MKFDDENLPPFTGFTITAAQMARFAAALEWNTFAFRCVQDKNDEVAEHFLQIYPNRDKFVIERWEERYLSLVYEWLNNDLRKPKTREETDDV